MQWQYHIETLPDSVAAVGEALFSQLEVADEETFLNPPHPTAIAAEDVGIDPRQLETAVERIRQAAVDDERILLFGDYDVDGMSGTALLWQVLHGLDMDVLPFLPDREKHGYGLSIVALEEIFAQRKPGLIITIDNGIVAHDAVTYAREQDVAVIITDHHQTDSPVDAVATVHTTQLCGATVAWMLARALAQAEDTTILEASGYSQLDLCALATVADQVPLLDANRSFTKHGLEELRRTQRPGLRALFDVAGYEQQDADSNTIGYGLGPRLNAAGRVGNPMQGLRLLCTNSQQRARQYAQELDRHNQERRTLTSEATRRANLLIEDPTHPLLFIEDREAHPGVIGLVAGRIAEEHHRPVIVVAADEEGNLVKASARSIPGVDITAVLRKAATHMESVGGHEMAAGFSAKPAALVQIKEILAEQARMFDATVLEPSLSLTLRLPGSLLDDELVELTQQFAPFGQENPRPTFGIEGVEVLEAKRVGSDKSHLKLTLRSEATQFDAIGWRLGEKIHLAAPGERIDIAGRVEFNEWRGRRSVQVVIIDLS